jgi:hypothetical protein
MPPFPGAPPGGGLQKTSFDGGVTNANMPPFMDNAGAIRQAQFANSAPMGALFPAQRTQVFFTKPAGMKIYWFTQGPDGKPNYSATPLETPGRYNFAQAAIYRLKLTHIPGRPALELYPTLEVVPTSPKTNEFLAHNAVPVEFTEADFKEVVDRNYIVKVIYLPDPQFQDAAGAGPEELVSTRLDPGQDPIQEALRRGSILLVVRIGNIDQGLQHSPGIAAPVPGGPPAHMKPPGHGAPPLMQVPFPVQPLVPGAPNPLPPIPDMKQPDKKIDNVPAPKIDEKKDGKKVEGGTLPGLPGLNLPAPPVGPADNLVPPPPLVNPAEKDIKPTTSLPPLSSVPIVPAVSSKEIEPRQSSLPGGPAVTLPALPSMDTPARPDLPLIPPLPISKQ